MVYCVLLKDTLQWRRWHSNLQPLDLESSTLQLSHCAPTHCVGYFFLSHQIGICIVYTHGSPDDCKHQPQWRHQQTLLNVELVYMVYDKNNRSLLFSGSRKIPILGKSRLPLEWWALGLGFSCPHWTPMMDSIYLTYPYQSVEKIKTNSRMPAARWPHVDLWRHCNVEMRSPCRILANSWFLEAFFVCREFFMLSWIEHEKDKIISRYHCISVESLKAVVTEKWSDNYMVLMTVFQ